MDHEHAEEEAHAHTKRGALSGGENISALSLSSSSQQSSVTVDPGPEDGLLEEGVVEEQDATELVRGLPGTLTALADCAQRFWMQNETSSPDLFHADAHEHVLPYLDAEDDLVVAEAARAMRYVCRGHREALTAVTQLGALDKLFAIISDKERRVEARAWCAANLIGLMWRNNTARDAVVNANLLSFIVELLRMDNPLARAHASGVLFNLTAGLDNHRDSVLVHDGLVEHALQLLQTCHGEICEHCAGFVHNLTAGSPAHREEVARQHGLLDILATMLANVDPVIREKAAGSVWNLALGPERTRRDIAEHPLICVRLMNFMRTSQSAREEELATGSMVNLMEDSTARVKQLLNMGIVQHVVPLLASSHAHDVQEQAAKACYAVAKIEEGTMPLIEAGAVELLEVLVQESDPNLAIARRRAQSSLDILLPIASEMLPPKAAGKVF